MNRKQKSGRNKVLVECEVCKSHFYISIWDIIRKKRKYRFCGKLCYYTFITTTSKDHPGEYFKKDQRRWFVYWRENGKRYIVPRARWMWEQEKGPIPDGFDIHHMNEIKTDDRMENFELWESYPHREYHKFSEEVDEVISEAENGRLLREK